MSFWDDLTSMFKRGVSVVAKKTDEYTKIGKIKVDIIGIKRDIEKQFNALGAKVYQLIVEENNSKIASNEDIKEILDKVSGLNKSLNEKKDDLEKVREEFAKQTGQDIEDVDVEEIDKNAPQG